MFQITQTFERLIQQKYIAKIGRNKFRKFAKLTDDKENDDENPQPSKLSPKNENKAKCPSTKKTKFSPTSITAETPPNIKAKSPRSPAKTKASTQDLAKISASSKRKSSKRKTQVKSMKNSTKTLSKTHSTQYSLAYHVKKFQTTHFIIFRDF